MKKQSFDVPGKRALIITTSHHELGEGGLIPFEKMSLRWPVASRADKRFRKDETLQRKARESLASRDVDSSAYDVIFFAGGWGAAYDLGCSD